VLTLSFAHFERILKYFFYIFFIYANSTKLYTENWVRSMIYAVTRNLLSSARKKENSFSHVKTF
jgi:hypothetical protein